MEKKFITKNGEVVKFGDVIIEEFDIEHPIFGKGHAKQEIEICEDTIDVLLEKGILKEVKHKNKEIPLDLDYYINSLAEKKGWKSYKMAGFLDAVYSINPIAAFSIILREVALKIDSIYEGNIKNCKEIFIINLATVSINKVSTSGLKNWNTFSAFRTKEDAKIALSITEELLKDIIHG